MYMYTIQKQFHVHGRGVSSYDYYLFFARVVWSLLPDTKRAVKNFVRTATTSREGPLSTNMELCVLIALSIPSVPSPRGRGHLSCICYSFLGKRQIHKCPTGRPADSYKKPTVGLKNVCKCHTLGTRQKVCFQLCKNRAQKLAFWIRWITTFQWKRIVLQYRNQTDNNVWTHGLNLF